MTQTAELLITRIFDAPPDLVFQCMTEPEHLTKFWGPVGMSTPIETIVVDLRVGGAFETTMVNDATGDSYTSRAVYTEITRPELLAWKDVDLGMTTSTTFVDLGEGRTEVRIHQTDVPEMVASTEAQAGFNSSLDRFAAHLATLA
jgi:uncharacterized protein YndB with AHSA1/START domain